MADDGLLSQSPLLSLAVYILVQERYDMLLENKSILSMGYITHR